MNQAKTADWLSQEFLADPYPHYAAMRETDPVHFDESRGSWLLFRYSHVEPALRDNERFSAEQQPGGSMLVTDPPNHTRLRTLVSKAFTVRTVSGLAPRIEHLVDELLNAAAARGEMDAIADFAYPLPITVIAEMLGVEAERRDFFRTASQKIAVAMGPITDAQTAFRAIEGRNELIAYFEELIPKRKADPRDDVLSALVQAEDRGDSLTHGELLAMLLLLLVGGHETTVNLIANGLLALLRNPDKLEQLRTESGIEKRAVEELLRYDAPVQYSGRVAKHDIEIGGKHIRAGDGVRMIIGSANRDPAAFGDPDRLDLTRDSHAHVAFGAGVHFCLGAQLARLEGQIALAATVRRFPKLRLATDELRWRPAPVLRGLEALPVSLTN